MNKKMKLKNTSKKILKKSFFYVIIIYLVFAITFYYSLKNSNSINNTKFINFLLGGGNSHMLEDYKVVNIVNSSMKFLFNIDIGNPSTILDNTIVGSSDNREILLEHSDDYSNLEELKKISSYIEDPNPVDINNPILYIYNSHQLENYESGNLDIYGITPNVLMASYLLKEKLNEKGISTIVETTNMTEFLNLNNWDYASSYKASRIFMLDKKNKYSSLKYYVDLHRDSVNHDSTTKIIDGKNYARVLFVVGLEHENYEANLELSEKVNNIMNKYYPGLSRGIYKKEGPGVDGIYNQDISPNTILIEVGGVENNIDEVLNTVEALSNIFNYLINGDNNA